MNRLWPLCVAAKNPPDLRIWRVLLSNDGQVQLTRSPLRRLGLLLSSRVGAQDYIMYHRIALDKLPHFRAAPVSCQSVVGLRAMSTSRRCLALASTFIASRTRSVTLVYG